MTMPSGRRPVIGLLANTYFDGYEEGVWRGVVHAAEELDVDLVYFLVGALAQHNSADTFLDVVDAASVDGIIALSGSIGWASGSALVGRRLERFGAIPVVSFSDAMGGAFVCVDNAAGIALAVEHLAREHGRRRIGFLSGPTRVGDGAARLRGYHEGLARAGLTFDPALVLEGDFSRDSARRAFQQLDRHPVELDALVAANDSMALVAIDELRRRGRSVPGDVAVCGFDDIADAASAALTTVRQPLGEMSRDAVRTIVAMLRGEAVAAERVFPAQLVLRQSCGCSRLGPEVPPPRALAPGDPGPLAAALEERFPELGPATRMPGWARDLSAGLLAAVAAADRGPFVSALERLLQRGLERVPEPDAWLRPLRALVTWARAGATEPDRARLAALHADANALVGSMTVGHELGRRLHAEEQDRFLRWLVQPFPSDEDDFVRALLDRLQAMGVRSCFISRFVDEARQEAALIGHFDLDGVAELEESPATFDPRRLIPGRFTGRRRRAHMVLPVSSPDGLIGFVLCEIGPMSVSGYEILMHELSMVLSVNDLMAELREQQRQVMESARQAGMAEVAVGALHNVGNLLNSVSVSAEEIRAAAATAVGRSGLARASALLGEHADDLPGFFAADPRARLLPGYFSRATEALGRDLERIQLESQELMERTGLIRDSVRALQDHARGGDALVLEETVELCSVVRSALEIQRAHLDRHRVQVREELDGVPPLQAPRSRLVHVLVNLVKNGVEAMRGVPEDRRVLVVSAARRDDGKIWVQVRDSGEGIAPGDLERIFTYGFTTKRDGHGFGLHTCANTMKQLGGALTASSDGPGHGATFTMVLDPSRRRA